MKEKYQKKKWESVKLNASSLNKVRKYKSKEFIKSGTIVSISGFYEEAAEKLLKEKS
jgi:hypothetical protein